MTSKKNKNQGILGLAQDFGTLSAKVDNHEKLITSNTQSVENLKRSDKLLNELVINDKRQDETILQIQEDIRNKMVTTEKFEAFEKSVDTKIEVIAATAVTSKTLLKWILPVIPSTLVIGLAAWGIMDSRSAKTQIDLIGNVKEFTETRINQQDDQLERIEMYFNKLYGLKMKNDSIIVKGK